MKTVKKTKLSRLADEYREARMAAANVPPLCTRFKCAVCAEVDRTRTALLAWAESERRR